MSTPSLNTERPYQPFRWFVLFTLFVVTATTALSLISPAPLVGEIVKTSGLDAGRVTWMTMGSFNLFVALSALFGGYFVDRLGFARVYLIGIALILIAWLLMPSMGDTYWGMFFLRFLQGIGTGPIMGSAAAVAANHFPISERGIVTGTQGAAMGTGIAVGLAVVPEIFSATGSWAHTLRDLWPAAVVALVLAAVVATRTSRQPVTADEEPLGTDAEQFAALKAALLTPVTWVAIGSVVLMSWVYQAFNDLTPGFLALDAPVGLGLGPDGSKLLIGAQLTYVVGSFLCGFVTERVFKGSARPGIVIGFTLGALFSVTMIWMGLSTSHAVIVTVLSLAAFFFAWVNPNAMGYIAKYYPKHITGQLGGLTMGIGIFGGTAGVAAGSAALHHSGRYIWSITIMVMVALIGAVLGLCLRQPKDVRTGEQAEAGVLRGRR